jgi:hypothetical protein
MEYGAIEGGKQTLKRLAAYLLILGGKSLAMPEDSKGVDRYGGRMRKVELQVEARRYPHPPLHGGEAEGGKGPVNLFPAERVQK